MTRRCPRCEVDLTPRLSQGIEVDLCTSCGGVYLDPSEFDRLIAERFEGKRLESTFAFTAIDADDPADCPACGAGMQVVDHEGLELDRCDACEGIWVDGDERSVFAERARQREEGVPDVYIHCDGCGASVPQRTCIKRMSMWWCEACVIAGNHPGPEAQLVGMHERNAAAMVAFTKAKVRQGETKHRQAEARQIANEQSMMSFRGRRARNGMLGATITQFVRDIIDKFD